MCSGTGKLLFRTNILLGDCHMSTTGLESLEHTVQLTHIWINELEARLGWSNKARAYRLLKAVLHGLRDWLQLNEMADLGAQLPGLLRGAYYEQWRPANTPVRQRTKEDFLARVNESFKQDPLPNTAQAVMAVFESVKKITRVKSRTSVTLCRKNSGSSGQSLIPHRARSAGKDRNKV
jgi:uncharacterized protein (DUF2267 family)